MTAGFLSRFLFCVMLLAAFPASASDRWGPWNPPARYDHPYHGRLIERELPRAQVLKACKKLFARFGFTDATTRGCSMETVIGKECTIIYANKTFMGTTPAQTRRHEIAHCNGWPADHPN